MVTRPDEQLPELSPDDVAQARTVADLALLLRTLRRREARRRGGSELTYRELAGRAGWSHAVVATYLTGRTLPPTDRFDALVQMLGAESAEQSALATARDRVEERRRQVASRPIGEFHLPVPRQTPADVPGFVGRVADLARLDRLIPVVQRNPTVVIAAVDGTAGVGKTALVVHWAHRVKRRFPDGQLYADLHGHGPQPPASPEQVLDGYLAGLGVPAMRTPPDLDAKAALYRSLLDGRRALIVLDNAASSQQVRPLLPGTPGCLVVVTSRHTLNGLAAHDRAYRLHLDLLPPDEAVALLSGFVGPARMLAERAAAKQYARLCAHLPVALCAAGERAAARPHATLASLVAELTSAENRLDLLEAGGDGRSAVRTVLSWSYQQLPPEAARLFRLLGKYPRPHVTRYVAAGLAGTSPERAGRLLDRLASANLLRHERPYGYRMHELLRAYAAERAGAAGNVSHRSRQRGAVGALPS